MNKRFGITHHEGLVPRTVLVIINTIRVGKQMNTKSNATFKDTVSCVTPIPRERLTETSKKLNVSRWVQAVVEHMIIWICPVDSGIGWYEAIDGIPVFEYASR